MQPSQPYAVVVGLNPNALGTIRSLAREGVPTVAVDHASRGADDTHTWMSSRTRLCEKVLVEVGLGENGLLDAILALARRRAGPGVLIPSSDSHVILISRNRERLSRDFRFVLPPCDVLDLLLSKVAFAQHVVACGVDAPRTWLPVGQEEVAEIAAEVEYPCIIKADRRDAAWTRVAGQAKAVVAHTPGGLERAYAKLVASKAVLMVQEIVPGGDDQLYFSHLYVHRDGRLGGLWTGRKIRQLPLGFGTSTLCETVEVPDVAAASLRLLEPLDFVGYASVEFKLDPRDGRFKVMEVTPGRTWYPHFLGTVAGMNIPNRWFRDALGLPTPAPSHVSPGVRWVDEYRDVHAAVEQIRNGTLSVRGWLRSYRAVRGFALFAGRDPAPILYMAVRLGLGLGRLVRRRFARLLPGTAGRRRPRVRHR